MNEKEILNIRAFINEKDMSDTVKAVLMRNFLRSRQGADVHVLAAQTLAVQFIGDAWAEMERHKKNTNEKVELRNIAL